MKIKTSFTKQLLSIVTCMALILTMLPISTLTVFAQYEPNTFINSEKLSHWGRSDLRAYLNNIAKIDNTLPFDSSNADNSVSYPSQFSNAEIALVQPYTYSTNVLDSQNVTSTYITTDRFWLPSGNYSNDKVISWGESDLSSDANYNNVPTTRVIPISYWPSGERGTWLRSTYGNYDSYVLGTNRGYYLNTNNLMSNSGVAAVCKIDLSSVIFASSVSAESVAAFGGSQRNNILGSSDFGKKTGTALPDYGMYLRQISREDFEATGLNYSRTTLTVNYTGGVAGQYVVVQAFKADDLINGTMSYKAVKELEFGQTSATLDVQNWGLDSLDGLTIKVWMEDASNGSSLAKATIPVSFVGEFGSITKTEAGTARNQRFFAMKEDLQTSWGTLADKTDLVGTNPTNQKIYFGKDSSGAPLQFWIAGRETYDGGRTPKDGDGVISSTGEIMTLYQAKSVETKPFNSSTANYKNVPTLVFIDGQTKVYSGEKQGPSYSYTFGGADIESTPSITYEYRKRGSGDSWIHGLPTNAGSYEVRGIAASTSDYETATSSPVTFTIEGAAPIYSAPNLMPQKIVYGSTLSQINISEGILGYPTFGGADISGTWAWADDSTSVGNVGTNTFKVKFTPNDTTNFDWSKTTVVGSGQNGAPVAEVVDAVLFVDVPITVQPLPIGISSITLSTSEFTYNGREQTPTIIITDANASTLTENTDYTIIWPDDKINAGQKEVKIKFQGNYAADNDGNGIADNPDNGVTITYEITKANYDMSGAKWNYTESFKYDGLEKTVEVTNLPDGVIAFAYSGNRATEVGEYTAAVSFDYDNINYNKPELPYLVWKIENNWTPTEYSVSTPNEAGWMNEDFIITASDGYKISTTNTADGNWSETLAYTDDTADGSVTFYLKNVADGTISLEKTVSYKIDKTVSTGKVEFVNRNTWEEFLNTISFGLFYKDEVTVKIESNDNLSGVASVEYYVSDTAMTLDEVKAITVWTEYTDSFGVAVEDTKKFVCFVRITDNAGNVTYLSTDGAEYDVTAPVISGIEDSKIYYTTQKVTVTDKNIESITLNGEIATSEITLDGNKDATYTVVATDKAGNSTTVTITMKPISELSQPIDNLNKDNVNSSNEQDLEGVKAAVSALDTTNATEAEKQALKDIVDKVAELEKIIDDINNVLYGDVNCDGKVSMLDVVSLQKVIAKLTTHEGYGEKSEITSDCNHDGKINLLDVTQIQKFIAKLLPDLDLKN